MSNMTPAVIETMNERIAETVHEVTRSAGRIAVAEILSLVSERDTLRAQLTAASADRADALRVFKFAGIILEQHYNDGEVGDVDGFFIQEQALACGLLEVVTRTEPCGEGCQCADAGDFPTQCYIRSKLGEAAIAAQSAPPCPPAPGSSRGDGVTGTP